MGRLGNEIAYVREVEDELYGRDCPYDGTENWRRI